MSERLKELKKSPESVEDLEARKKEATEDIEEEKMPEEALAFKEKLNELHIEAQRIKLEIAKLAKLYKDAHSAETNDLSAEVLSKDWKDIIKEAEKLLVWEENRNIYSAKGSLQYAEEACRTASSMKAYISYFENETKRLEVERSRLSKEKNALDDELKKLDEAWIGKKLFTARERSKKKKVGGTLDKEISELDSVMGKNKYTQQRLLDEKGYFVRILDNGLKEAVTYSISELSNLYQFDPFAKDYKFLRDRVAKDYLYASLPRTDDPEYVDLKKELDEALPDFYIKDSEAHDGYTVQSHLKKLEIAHHPNLWSAVSRVSSSRSHRSVLNGICIADCGNEVRKMLEPLSEAGFSMDAVFVGRYFEASIDQDLRAILANHSSGIDSQDVEIWAAVREDSIFKKVFGKSIQQLDSTIEKRALDSNEKTESSELRVLEHFPSRTAFNRLLLTILSSSTTYDTRNAAEFTMSKALKKDDAEWNVIFEKVLQKYPEAQKMFDELKSTAPFGRVEHQTLKSFFEQSSFVPDLYAVLDREEVPEKVSFKRVVEAMNIDSLMNIATEKGLLTKEQVEEVLAALEKVLVVPEKWSSPSCAPHTEFARQIRQYIIDLLTESSITAEQKDVFVLTIIMPLARKINECEPNDEKRIGDLSEHPILEMYKSYLRFMGVNSAYDPVKQLKIISSDPEHFKDIGFILEYAKEAIRYPIFNSKEGLEYLVSFAKSYSNFTGAMSAVLENIKDGSLTQEQALLLPTEAPDLLYNTENSDGLAAVWVKHSKYFLSSPEGIESARKCKKKYGENASALILASSLLENNVSLDTFINLPENAPALIDIKEKENKKPFQFAVRFSDYFFDSPESVAFTNRVAGLYGNQAEKILEGYIECVKAGVLKKGQFNDLNEFLDSFRVVAPAIVKGFLDAKATYAVELYFAELNSLAERMLSSESILDKEREKSYFNDLVKHVYPQNSSNFGSYETIRVCEDRSSDIAQYNIHKKYEIDLLASGEISIKSGEALNQKTIDKTTSGIYVVRDMFESVGFDPEKMKVLVDEQISGLIPEQFSALDREEKIFALLAETLYGRGDSRINKEKVKQIVMAYEFSQNEDVRDYIKGTSDRVSNASNKDYAMLCELNEFYNDRIKEVYRRVAEKAYTNEDIRTRMGQHFSTLSAERNITGKKDKVNKLQVDKLGLSEGFLSQLKKDLEKRSGRKYSDAQVKRIVRMYEKIAGGLKEKGSTSSEKSTQAFYGKLKSQRQKTMAAIKELTGEEINPESLHLGEMNLAELIKEEEGIINGVYNEDQFASYTIENSIRLFSDEQNAIAGELDKFQSSSGGSRKILNAYITKSKESANARMTGGVCVAADNPRKGEDRKNIWDMENYLQMVFQDPESLICQGLVLLHAEEVDGEKVLCASINPSSTYLYSVDERALFNGIMKSLETFADENGFGKIAVSSNKAIRTNRTGGQFEKEMDLRTLNLNETLKFDPPRPFSYGPAYNLTAMDVVWKKK